MTTLAVPSPAQQDALSADLRPVGVFADLVPEEVVAARRAAAMKRRVLVGLAVTLFMLTTGFGISWWQTHSSRSDLTAEQSIADALQAKRQSYQGLVLTEARTSRLQQTLNRLMVGDIQWTNLIEKIRASAPKGVHVTSVTSTVTVGAANKNPSAPTRPDALDVLNQTGQQQVGTMTIGGSSPDKNSVATFVDRLGKVPGLAAAFPASVSSNNGKLTFSVSVILTSDALGGRFAIAPPTTTGAH